MQKYELFQQIYKDTIKAIVALKAREDLLVYIKHHNSFETG